MKFRKINNVFFVGIGGIGMSGIAEVLVNLGFQVTGSDINENLNITRLRKLGVQINIGHSKENINSADIVVISSAIENDNIELVEARKKRVPIVKRAEMLAELMRFSYGIAIAGTHGKTTTTSILSFILNEAKYDPTYIIGGKINNAGNSKLGSSDYLIAEADESDASFLHLQPLMSIITNIDKDHLENHKNSFDVLKKNFLKFISNLPFYGLCLLNLNDINTKSIINKISRPFKTYGLDILADYNAKTLSIHSIPSTFIYNENGMEYVIKSNMPGRYNAMNSLAALSLARELGIPIKTIQKAIECFPGISRRFEIHGEFEVNNKKFTWVDDYGHHPTEIKEVLETINNVWKEQRVVMVFQPHRYSRTAEYFNQFVDTLKNVQDLILMEIYAANEREIENISSSALVEEISKYGVNVVLINNHKKLKNFISQTIKNNDILLTMGAGDISKFNNYFKESLK